MQRIEYPKGSKVIIDDGVILIEPAEKWEPKIGEIVRIQAQEWTIIAFYTKARGNNVATGIDCDNKLYINEIGIHDNFVFYQPSQEDKRRLLTALSEAGYQYNEKTHKVDKIRWKPEIGDLYWTFTATRVFDDTNENTNSDIERINNNFAFKTEAEAQEFFDQVKELAKKR